ncbi:MAG TPA: helix-turn-helix transcriptional regulator [Symbiobacteriaceae bacterium]|nr:helix-turn-helix transcriptional regulator [Symbiobacteriaceae bacterium]
MPKLDRRRVNPSPANIVGPRVKATRLEGGLSQAVLAATVQEELERIYPGIPFHLDQSDISRLESGKRPVWDYEVRALALALHVPTDYLLHVASKEATDLNENGAMAET